MAKQMRRILVAIRDVSHAPKNELRKAAALARAAHASIELFHAVEAPDPGASWPESLTAAVMQQQRLAIAAKRQHRLEQFARDPSLRGLTVTCTVSWDHPPHEAIIRRAHAGRADLVIAATHHHGLRARLLLRNTDWELIRYCPVPLLLVKSRRPYQRPVVLVAVDPFHAHARPADLDARLLDAGASYARWLRGSLHVFHAYLPLVSLAPVPVGAAPLIAMPPEAEEAHGEQIARSIGQLAARAGVPPARRHLLIGDVATELAAVTRRARVSLVVMGAVSRSALARLFIGNTAERVLERVGCDVLIVKPRGFKSPALLGPAPRRTKPAPRRRRPPLERTAALVLPPLL